MGKGAIYKALLISPSNDRTLEVFNPGYLTVSDEGVILESGSTDPRGRYKNFSFFDFSEHLITPGFVDLHTHLPQYAFAGIACHTGLLEWLENYTFPREESFGSLAVSNEASERFFADLIQNGTTTALVFSSPHQVATEIAFKTANRLGIRAGIGMVMMDQNAPSSLLSDKTTLVCQSEELIEKWHKRERLFYVLTPRYALSCSMGLLKAVSKLAKRHDLLIQTHLSENKDEILRVRELFGLGYTELYQKAGLLGDRTVVAHAIHLDKKECKLLKESNTKIAHCPTSNRFLSSGIMPLTDYLDLGLTVGLGTDIAGGYSLFMLHEAKEAIENSKTYRLLIDPDVSAINIGEAFYLATLGGARALGMENQIGSLEPGKAADFLVIDYRAVDPSKGKGNYQSPEEILSRCLYRGHEGIVKSVYIQGQKVK